MLIEKRWNIKDYAKKEEISRLSQALNIHDVLANLLLQRGIKTYREAQEFFNPSLDNLHDPFLMKDMRNAVNRLTKAVREKQGILIFGDYDVDGTTSVALVYSFLTAHYNNIDYYVPDRYTEGYGISEEGIDFAKKNNYSLIIALDCGIKAVEKVEYANQKGIDFIICDHHNPGDEIPNAVAVLDPKRTDCDYPFDELSGCGVGFKLLQGFASANDIPFYELEPFLDLVAVSIASDIVPISGENRVLAHHGLQWLNGSPRAGLKSIIKVAGLQSKQITINDIVFKIGPRINAAGRIESAKKSVDLLVSESEIEATEFGFKIDDINNERRQMDQQITQEALNMISSSDEMKNKKCTVLFQSHWHKGVIGIVASRLTETYYRPTIILTESNGFATGSARSVEGFDLYQAIEQCADLLENFGGHMYAAGLTLKMENIEEFISRFENHVNENITDLQLTPSIDVDVEIHLNEISPVFFKELKKFAPFGPGNMSPVFLTENVTDYGYGKAVGKNKEHLRLYLIENDDTSHVMPAIAFQLSEWSSVINNRIPFNVVYSIDENNFRGKTSLQLMIKDIKIDLD